MAKVYIIHENDEWTEPLINALKEMNVPFEDWHLHEGVVPLNETPPEGIFYNRMSASSHSRGHRYAPELTAAVLSWLHRHGRVVLNNERALQLEVSKVAQYEALKAHDILVPATAATVGNEALVKAAETFTTPFITKHNRAGKGLGVELFNSADALKESASEGKVTSSVDGIMLLQQYIASPSSSITRCEFVGGKFMYAVRVDTSEGFELCPADACEVGDQFCPTGDSAEETSDAASKPKFEIIEGYTSPLIEKYERFLAANGITFAGIENITDKDGVTYTYDVNTNTNYNQLAEEKTGIYGMKQVATHLKKKLSEKYGMVSN